ncbi:CLUMA_CG008101, isoform A, partial [Clunio marinus]
MVWILYITFLFICLKLFLVFFFYEGSLTMFEVDWYSLQLGLLVVAMISTLGLILITEKENRRKREEENSRYHQLINS